MDRRAFMKLGGLAAAATSVHEHAPLSWTVLHDLHKPRVFQGAADGESRAEKIRCIVSI